MASVLFKDLDALEEALSKRCVQLGEQPELIRSYTLYDWWPQAA